MLNPISKKSKIIAFNEKSLHAQLKKIYAKEDGLIEQKIGKYYIDVVLDGRFYEIQTKNFSAIKAKLNNLIKYNEVCLVYPVPLNKWIVKLDKLSQPISNPRKSPKKGHTLDIFEELVSFPGLIKHTNFSLEIVLIDELEKRIFNKKKAWKRKGWTIYERELLEVNKTHRLETAKDFRVFLPADLDEPFSTNDIAKKLRRSIWFARKMIYCLREMGTISQTGKKGNLKLYSKTEN